MNIVIRFDPLMGMWYSHIRTGNSWRRYVTFSVWREGCIAQLEGPGYGSW